MRNRLMSQPRRSCWPPPALARAQQRQPHHAGAAGRAGTGSIDFGFRGSAVDGDEARYERYRDLRDGAVLEFIDSARAPTAYRFTPTAANIGYHDQRYGGRLQQRQAEASAFVWTRFR